jgi:hypothetical protein
MTCIHYTTQASMAKNSRTIYNTRWWHRSIIINVDQVANFLTEITKDAVRWIAITCSFYAVAANQEATTS